MAETTIAQSRIYTDIQGLDQLKYQASKNSPEAKKEVAEQFEAMLVQMVMNSMRQANKAFASDSFGSDAMDMYQDLFDKQMSLVISGSGLGFADQVLKNIDQQQGIVAQPATSPEIESATGISIPKTDVAFSENKNDVVLSENKIIEKPNEFLSQEDFVKRLWNGAKWAGETLGIGPEILLAQAALETNWGKSILPHGKDASSFNLFNIKADTSWGKPTTTVDAIEQKDGILTKEKSNFRSYSSFDESFKDYVDFIKQNPRYTSSLQNTDSPLTFISKLQHAGYATDKDYADKIMKIFGSHTFQNLIAKMKGMT